MTSTSKNILLFCCILIQMRGLVAQSPHRDGAKLTLMDIAKAPALALDRFLPLHHLDFAGKSTLQLLHHADYQHFTNLTPTPITPTLIPKWSADDLPFFCKIEHKYLTRFPIPAIFRLGW